MPRFQWRTQTTYWNMAAAVRETETYEFIRTQVTLNNKKREEYGKFIRWIIEKRDKILLLKKLVINSNCVFIKYKNNNKSRNKFQL